MNDGFIQNNVSLDGLAAMVARGFEDITCHMATKDDILRLDGKVDKLDQRIDRFEKRIDNLESRMISEIAALRKDIENFVVQTDKRYLELKHRQDVIVTWLLKLAEKNQIELNMEDLEYKS